MIKSKFSTSLVLQDTSKHQVKDGCLNFESSLAVVMLLLQWYWIDQCYQLLLPFLGFWKILWKNEYRDGIFGEN